MPVPAQVSLKDRPRFKIVGKPAPRLDTPEKVNGRAIFGIDVIRPGMLTALVARPPVFGGKVKSFDASKAKAVPGVRDVVQIGFRGGRRCGQLLGCEKRAGRAPD